MSDFEPFYDVSRSYEDNYEQGPFGAFAEALKDAAEQWRDVELAEDDCLIALASCDVSGDWSESATVLIGRIEKVEETSE